MFVQSYLQTAATIIAAYNGAEPLAHFLKKYFAAHKKFGSRDRKQISHLVFCYYRLGGALQGVSLEQRLLAGLFLCSQTPQPVLEQLAPDWNEMIGAPLAEKTGLVQAQLGFDVADIFPFVVHLSNSIDVEEFNASFLVQPDTYLRPRPGKKQQVIGQLQQAGISFVELPEGAIAVPPAARLDDVLQPDRDAVVQDRSSQQVLSLLSAAGSAFAGPFSAWDCCAASGGKTILLHDIFPQARLTVSDIRPSILANLRQRFSSAGIQDFRWFVGDLSDPHFQHPTQYDLVLCDAPCSGSGTWGRAPEWLLFFKEEKIKYYAGLQRSIAAKAAQSLKPGGYLLYITCSVFRAENEDVADFLQQECGLALVNMEYFSGYTSKADTLFAALFRKPANENG